ncbi:hypothetical protein ACJX0J_013809, partial [Zea mays]
SGLAHTVVTCQAKCDFGACDFPIFILAVATLFTAIDTSIFETSMEILEMFIFTQSYVHVIMLGTQYQKNSQILINHLSIYLHFLCFLFYLPDHLFISSHGLLPSHCNPYLFAGFHSFTAKPCLATIINENSKCGWSDEQAVAW